jgi:hypothetical protein
MADPATTREDPLRALTLPPTLSAIPALTVTTPLVVAVTEATFEEEVITTSVAFATTTGNDLVGATEGGREGAAEEGCPDGESEDGETDGEIDDDGCDEGD